MSELKDKIYLYRMVHIDNLNHILERGITHKNSEYANLQYKAIGDNSLIDTRSEIAMPNGRVLGEYIPFYFHYRMPMLYVLQNGFNQVKPCHSSQIVYCITSVQKVCSLGLPFNFTDGHAVSKLSHFYDSRDIDNIEELLDFDAIKKQNWKSEEDLDLKRRKEAEFLILGDLPLEGILGFVVSDMASKKHIDDLGSRIETVVRPNFYF